MAHDADHASHAIPQPHPVAFIGPADLVGLAEVGHLAEAPIPAKASSGSSSRPSAVGVAAVTP